MTTLLADTLFKDQRRRVLGLLLLNADKSYHVREIARLTGTVAGTIHKELKKLEQAGILSAHKQGNQLHYQANRQCPVFDELAGLMRKTAGFADSLRLALTPLAEQINVAFVFGSMASGEAGNHSDIDICVVGEVGFGDVVKALYASQQTLGREINPKCFSSDEWQQSKQRDSAFINGLLTKPAINLIGNRDDLR